MSQTHQLRVVACEAARGAGAVLRDHFARGREYTQKSGSLDLVTEADRASEAAISTFLEEHFPDHGFFGEEGGQRHAADGKPVWIVDPLDGTTNFAHRIPAFAVSIAAVIDSVPVACAVYDPMRDELFSAARGGGATLGEKALRVSDVDEIGRSILATGFPYDRRERIDFYLAHWKAAALGGHGVRRCGAAAIDLAWIAAGRFDGFWEYGLKAWDIAAGALLVEEAGGRVTDLAGGALALFGQRIAATNGRIHGDLLALLESSGAPQDQAPPVPPAPEGFS
jgi:myo-inositol-1(or 4)-monophosphatase